MATETKTFYPGAHSESTLQLVSGGANPVGKGSDNTTYATLRSKGGAKTYIRWPFDLSAIPDGAAIDSVACKAKVRFRSSVHSTTAKVQISSGSALKGSSVSLPQSPSDSNAVLTVTDAGTWTRDELQSCNLYIEATSKSGASNSEREIRFYGADLTVTYTYNAEKFMLKTGGAWADAARVFKKVSGIWVEQTELSSVVEDGVRYQNGGEIESTAPKAIPVTITGKGDAKFCFATINGTKYISAASGIEVMPGYTVRFTVWGNSSTTYVVINGTKVHTGAPNIETSYDWTIPDGVSSISIELYDNGFDTAQITVTTA